MNMAVGRARIGQWYARWDKGEIFQVIGYDEDSRTIEIQTFDGDLDEIDEETWSALPLAFAEQPEDWTGPVDDVERDDLGYSETDMRGVDWSEHLRQIRAANEELARVRPATLEEEGEVNGEDTTTEALVLEGPIVPQRLR